MTQFDESRQAKSRMDEVIQKLDEAFKGIHTGRASTTLVENIQVSSYGQSMPVKGLASLTIPEPSQIAITPWDKGQLSQIEAAIRDSDLGVGPVNDGNAIRVTFPPMTAERREALKKQVHKIAEEARIALRNLRHEALDSIKKAIAAETATDDDKFSLQKELDKLIEDYNGKIEGLVKGKETEIETV